MRLAMLGLGRMGLNMVTRLLRGGHEVVAYNRSEPPRKTAVAEGAIEATTVDEVVSLLPSPRVAWVMMPAGAITTSFIHELMTRFSPGDLIIDGGNNYYRDTIIHAQMLKEHGIGFLDVGTSGGIWGVTEGYSMMVGGDAAAVELAKPALETLAPSYKSGWGHVGPAGSGHFVKMVHNGIEYGMMQAYAEGFDLMQHKSEFNLDLKQIGEIWQEGSVVRSWLLDLAVRALQENPTLDGIASYVEESGEGRWTVMEAIDLKVPLPVIAQSLFTRYRSQEDSPFAEKMLAALRNQFGGHAMKREE